MIRCAGIYGASIGRRVMPGRNYADKRSGAKKRGKFSRFGLITGSCYST